MKKKLGPADIFNLLVALAVLLAVIVGGIVLIANGISSHHGGEIAGGVFLVASGALVPVWVGAKLFEPVLRRHLPGATPPTIQLELDKARVAPGEQVSGHVRVLTAGHTRALDVSLRCRDSSTDYKGTSWSTTTATLATGELPAPTEYTFTLALPPDAPPTYASAGVAVWWEVDARCDLLGTDQHAISRIEVALPGKR